MSPETIFWQMLVDLARFSGRHVCAKPVRSACDRPAAQFSRNSVELFMLRGIPCGILHRTMQQTYLRVLICVFCVWLLGLRAFLRVNLPRSVLQVLNDSGTRAWGPGGYILQLTVLILVSCFSVLSCRRNRVLMCKYRFRRNYRSRSSTSPTSSDCDQFLHSHVVDFSRFSGRHFCAKPVCCMRPAGGLTFRVF